MLINNQKFKFHELIPYALLMMTLYVVVVMSALNWNYMPDDGYRYLHVVSNLLDGLGVRWNAVDLEPSQSFTSFPWILSLAGVAMITDINLVELSKYFGLTCFCLSLIILFGYSIKHSRHRIISSVFLASAFCLSPVVFFHTVNGMETMLFLLFLTCSVVSFLLSLDDKRLLTATFLGFLITVLIRYEAVIFCGLLSLYLMYRYRNEPVFFFQRFFIFLILPGLTYAALVYLYFGSLLPNSFYVKTAVTLISTSGYSYFIENYNTFFLGCSVAFLGLYPFSQNRNKKAYLLMFIALHIQLLFILRIIPTVGQGGRFMFPYIVPLYLITINIPIQTMMERFLSKDFVNKSLSVVFVFVLIFSTYSSDRKAGLKDLISYSSERVMDPVIGKSLAELNVQNPSNISIVGGESGAISYFSKFTFVDIWGLHDSHIARNGLDNDYIFSYEPDMFISFVHKDALSYDDQGNFSSLDMDFINSRIEIDEKNKDIKGNTAYFSYLVMSDERFSQLKLVRTIDIGSGKAWIFFANDASPYSKNLIEVINGIDWDNDRELIVSSMRPGKIVKALMNPFNGDNYTKVEVMFDE